MVLFLIAFPLDIFGSDAILPLKGSRWEQVAISIRLRILKLAQLQILLLYISR